MPVLPLGHWQDASSTLASLLPSSPPCSQFPIPDSRFPIPDSRFPIPDSRFPIPDSLFPASYSLLPSLYVAHHHPNHY
ncbi:MULTISPECIES: hypothetical protein [unclassified Moorena]|uniref:hypothetical protein n=1 Tax=unclassified Moorena TaxID=2683338 RepID=UPI001401B7D2|nr:MULTISPECIES: hypothetical protein [unclassified Moorena]NEO17413.1 hypothetical protein [Moorena sp. SIO3E8]NEQ04080.1 hypothetical protein [Moorena sp. SIO3F7]